MSTSLQREREKCRVMGHMYVVTYRRPLRKLFRKVYTLRCWGCDLEVGKWG